MDDLTPTPEQPSGEAGVAWRRVLGRIVAPLVLAAVASLIGFAAANSGQSHAVLTTSAGAPQAPVTPTTATTAATVTTAVSQPSPPTSVVAPPTTVAKNTAKAAPTTSTTALVCLNSYNPSCGPFRWSPAPTPGGSGNVTISYSPAQPTVGQMVTFTVSYSDASTTVSPCGNITFGDMFGQGCSNQYAPCSTRYGPWEPPQQHAYSGKTTFTHEYTAAGTYTVSDTLPVGSPCYDPYQGDITGSVTITVVPQSTATAVGG